MTKEITSIAEIKKEVSIQLADKETMAALVATTFKGLSEINVKKAVVEGMMRGFVFKDFLEKNVYAIPFSGGYSLVTSIDYARKIGMRSGVVGTSAPTYEEKDGQVVSCTITVKRKIEDYVGDYSATVYFGEYNTGNNQWAKKPRTMIAKVAEMHALRKACPEELSQAYVEEDFQKSAEEKVVEDNLTPTLIEQVNSAKTLDELKTIYKANEGLGKEFAKLVTAKKAELTPKKNETA